MKPLFLAGMPSWLIPIIIVGVFGVIVLAVILIKKNIKAFKTEEKPKSDKEIAQEEMNRLLVSVDDPEVEAQMKEYESDKSNQGK